MSETEIWKQVVGYESYLVSNLGNVKSKQRVVHRSDGGVRNMKSKVLKPGTLPNGYKQVILSVGGEYFSKRVHRLVAESFIENSDNKPDVNHKNGVTSDNRVENLEWCTESENTRHSYTNLGRMPTHGETHNKAILTLEQVREIRKKQSLAKRSCAKLGREYGVDRTTISKIINGNNWKHDI